MQTTFDVTHDRPDGPRRARKNICLLIAGGVVALLMFFCTIVAVVVHLKEERNDNPHLPSLEVFAEWVTLEYDWTPAQRAEAIESGEFTPANNVLAGLKVCNPSVAKRCQHEMVFGTVPRWATGVPATLVIIVDGTNNTKVLRPWPSQQIQTPTEWGGDCSLIQYVQSMEIDPHGIMWVLDVGRKYFTQPNKLDNTCPPKILCIDVVTGKVIASYTFPDDIASHNASFLNDLVLDVPRQVAFITDAGNGPTDKGAIIVYDHMRKASRRFEDTTTYEDSSAHIVVHGLDLSGKLTTPADGIALTPSRDRLFFCPLAGYGLFSVDTDLLRNFSLPTSEISKSVVKEGAKPSNSDGMTFGSDGNLYFGGMTTNSLYKWTPGTKLDNSDVVANDAERLWWIDTFAFDNEGSIWLTTNKLSAWFFGAQDGNHPHGLDISGASGANYRIIKIAAGSNSYMKPLDELALPIQG